MRVRGALSSDPLLFYAPPAPVAERVPPEVARDSRLCHLPAWRMIAHVVPRRIPPYLPGATRTHGGSTRGPSSAS